MATDRRWVAIATLGTVAVFVLGMSLFPTSLTGAREWSPTGTALRGRRQCSNHNDELARFVRDAIESDKVSVLAQHAVERAGGACRSCSRPPRTHLLDSESKDLLLAERE